MTHEHKFNLGKIVATPAAIAAMEENGHVAMEFIVRHHNLEQGELDDEDYHQNIQATFNGSRIMSSFKMNDGNDLWVITESDRSSTCLLLPSDY